MEWMWADKPGLNPDKLLVSRKADLDVQPVLNVVVVPSRDEHHRLG